MGEDAYVAAAFECQEPFLCATVSCHCRMGRNNNGPRSTEANLRREEKRRELLQCAEQRGRSGCICLSHLRCVCDLGQGVETRPSKVATGLGVETRPSSRLEGPIGGESSLNGTSTDSTEEAGGTQGRSQGDKEPLGQSRSRSRSRPRSRSTSCQGEPSYYWQGKYASKAGQCRGYCG